MTKGGTDPPSREAAQLKTEGNFAYLVGSSEITEFKRLPRFCLIATPISSYTVYVSKESDRHAARLRLDRQSV